MSDEEKGDEFNGNAFQFLSMIEEEMECSGACWKPLFGVARNLADGPVAAECVEVLTDSLATLMGPAVVCLITFFVLLCAFCCSIPLCTGFDPDEKDSDEE